MKTNDASWISLTCLFRDRLPTCCCKFGQILDEFSFWNTQELNHQNNVIFTVRNSSCEKVMFSQVSVCPQGGGVHPRLADIPGRQTPPRQADTPPTPEMATAADGTYPTGMHSCPLYKRSTRKMGAYCNQTFLTYTVVIDFGAEIYSC